MVSIGAAQFVFRMNLRNDESPGRLLSLREIKLRSHPKAF
jgi:hypothetical protein